MDKFAVIDTARGDAVRYTHEEQFACELYVLTMSEDDAFGDRFQIIPVEETQ